MKFEETYQCVAISTWHMTYEDSLAMELLAGEGKMVMEREYGFFMKLCDNPELNHYPTLSKELNRLIRILRKKGFKLIEFDRDAEVVEGLQTWEW